MRTDAKIGFAIGGVLLAVLAVYLIVVPRHSKKTGVALVTTVDPAADASTATTSSPAPTPAPVNTPPMTAADNPAFTPVAPPLPAPATQPVDDHKLIVNRDTHDNPSDGAFHPITPPAKADNSETDAVASRGGPVLPPMMDVIPPADDIRPAPIAHHSSSSTHHRVVTAEKTETVGTQKTYTVKPGQTLSSIAQEVYGNARFWVAIARENKSIDPKHLKIGEKINLPDVSEVRPGPVLVDVIEPVATSGGSAVDTTGSTYRVQSGDSLYKISKKLFGTGKKATAIYQLNKALIGDDETRLKPGMLLRIPEGARVAVSSAR